MWCIASNSMCEELIWIRKEFIWGYFDGGLYLICLERESEIKLPCKIGSDIRGCRSELPEQWPQSCGCVHSCLPGMACISTFQKWTRKCFVAFLACIQGYHWMTRQRGWCVYIGTHTGEEVIIFISLLMRF